MIRPLYSVFLLVKNLRPREAINRLPDLTKAGLTLFLSLRSEGWGWMFVNLFASAFLLCLQLPCDGEICMRSPQGLHKGYGIHCPNSCTRACAR